MSVPFEFDTPALITRLRQRAERHRRLAQVLTTSEDARLALSEANQAEAEANRIESEMEGVLLGTSIPAAFQEQVLR